MKLIYLDSEVTGLGEQDKICQLAYLVADDKTDTRTLHEDLCNPLMPITTGASECHGITDEVVKTKLPLKEVSSFFKLLEYNNPENCIIAHNAQFDLKMLARDGFKWQGKVLDTLECARKLYNKDTNIKSFALQNLRVSLNLASAEEQLATELSINVKAHDAAGDVISMYVLLEHLCEAFDMSIDDMIVLSNKKEKLSHMPFGKYRDKKFSEIAKSDPQYLSWIIQEGDFSETIKYSAISALEYAKEIVNE